METKESKNKVKIVKSWGEACPNDKCPVCKWGLGLHAMGYPSPMGPIDGADGLPTIACPKCGANKNPINKDDTKV